VLTAESFFNITIGNTLTLAGILLAYLGYRRENKTLTEERKKEWEHLIKEQAEMHTENRMRLDTLLKSQNKQEDVNNKRDKQIHELTVQTSTLGEMAKGFNRRLEMLEDK